MLEKQRLSTPREGFLNITHAVQDAVSRSGVLEGQAIVFVPHTTAGVTINENADPDVPRDLLLGLERAFPDRPEFRHAEGNSSAHLRASAMGSSVTVFIQGGALLLGTWQGVFFAEFDGPRSREFLVKIVQD
ncbi:MAG: secondary thiamine-phosphate synthase enzyme YjbQ [Deltaproteobacteria bacterium]|jgi:secondary thiamine-phosphate synthase enzyme|nr:secondary thiamine-phosphate synthase enzyme YjbQ [Deltaproteobacteria bacterium]